MFAISSGRASLHCPPLPFGFLRTNHSNARSVNDSASPAPANGTTGTSEQSSKPRETSELGRPEADGTSLGSTITARSQLGLGAGSSGTPQTPRQMPPAAGSVGTSPEQKLRGTQQLSAVTFAANSPVLAVGKKTPPALKFSSASNYHEDIYCYK